DRLRPCLQAWPERHRFEAKGFNLPLRALPRLAQNEELGCTGGEKPKKNGAVKNGGSASPLIRKDRTSSLRCFRARSAGQARARRFLSRPCSPSARMEAPRRFVRPERPGRVWALCVQGAKNLRVTRLFSKRHTV